jgi:hypothetical protein
MCGHSWTTAVVDSILVPTRVVKLSSYGSEQVSYVVKMMCVAANLSVSKFVTTEKQDTINNCDTPLKMLPRK